MNEPPYQIPEIQQVNYSNMIENKVDIPSTWGQLYLWTSFINSAQHVSLVQCRHYHHHHQKVTTITHFGYIV